MKLSCGFHVNRIHGSRFDTFHRRGTRIAGNCLVGVQFTGNLEGQGFRRKATIARYVLHRCPLLPALQQSGSGPPYGYWGFLSSL